MILWGLPRVEPTQRRFTCKMSDHASAREHDCSGYWQAVGDANRLKKVLYRHNFIPEPWGVYLGDLELDH